MIQGKLPALGWNSWSAYRGNINESIIEKTAELFISLGLKDAGYEYVNMDDYWGDYSGRDKNGKLRANPSRFPNGIQAVTSKIHSLGLKAGIYSSASVETCGGYPASLNHEEVDAATFADWGIDYLKYDNCQRPKDHPGVEVVDQYDFCTPQSDADMFNGKPVVNGSCAKTSRTAPPGYNWKSSNTYKRYDAMSKALRAQKRDILYSLCDWGWADVRSWGPSIAQSWRVASDIQDPWVQITGAFNQALFMANTVDFYSHNDMDILQVGNGKLTTAECRTHFAIWAAMKSPILLGTDLGSLSRENLEILKNKYLLAFHQDSTHGKPAVPFNWNWKWDRTSPTANYWSGASSAGTLVLLFNPNSKTQTMTAKWADVPELRKSGSYKVTDIWTGKTSCVANELTREVIAHDTAGVLVGKEC